MTFRTFYNSKSSYLVNAIIETEDFNLAWAVTEDALGDTVIEVTGSKEEIRIFREIYEMVAN